MRTSKPIAGISYNSDAFLAGKLMDWRREGIIEFGMFIKHKPEEGEKKEHFHVFIRPAKLVQTLDLEDESKEFDPEHPDKPFKICGLTPSSESDWLLYSIHDPMYLAEKGLERVHHYGLDDIVCTDEDTFRIVCARVSDHRKGRPEYRILQMINSGMSFSQMVASGMIPMKYIYAAKLMYEAVGGSGGLQQATSREHKD